MYQLKTAKSVLVLCVLLLVTSCWTLRSDLPQSMWSEQPLSDLEVEVLFSELNRPWGLSWIDEKNLLITEREGNLVLLDLESGQKQYVRGVPSVFAAGQGGLLDVKVLTSGEIVLVLSAGSNEANRTEVIKYDLDLASQVPALTNGQTIFTNNEYKSGNQHFGARIVELPDSTLLISVGDGGNPPVSFGDSYIREQAQEPTTLFGNVVRIGPDGSIPMDNPFTNKEGYRPEIFAYGNRNIQGLAFDPISERIWATEHGARGGDELNLIRSGENYGWPLVSHSREYIMGTPIGEGTSLDGYTDPTLVWLDTVAPSGLAVVGNTLYAGGLVSRSVHVLVTDDQGLFLSESIVPVGHRVRDVKIGPDGDLYVLTDESNTGKLLRIQI